jgi:2'-5' RNA ligase
MGAYVVVVFIRPVRAGHMFPRSDWPLHITLARFDSKEPAEGVAERIGRALSGWLGFDVRTGADDFFGRNHSVPVSLVEPHPQLQLLHDRLLDELGTDVHLLSPHHARQNFRPHISHQAEGRLQSGEVVRVAQAALVDMRPDGDSKHRRVLAVWNQAGSPAGRVSTGT